MLCSCKYIHIICFFFSCRGARKTRIKTSQLRELRRGKFGSCKFPKKHKIQNLRMQLRNPRIEGGIRVQFFAISNFALRRDLLSFSVAKKFSFPSKLWNCLELCKFDSFGLVQFRNFYFGVFVKIREDPDVDLKRKVVWVQSVYSCRKRLGTLLG